MQPLSSVLSVQVPPFRDNRSDAVRSADPKNILGSGRLHPVLGKKIEQLIEKAAAQGMDLYLQEGYRSPEAQGKIPSGNTRAKPGYSFHNYGLAADVVFRNKTGAPSWAENHDWQRLGELGKSVGLEWGGDWKSIQDRPHFQFSPHHGIGEIRQLFQEGGLKRVWDNIK
jgi:hypothetical protein